MKMSAASIRLSASDLSNHLACRHLTVLDLNVAAGGRHDPPGIPRMRKSYRNGVSLMKTPMSST